MNFANLFVNLVLLIQPNFVNKNKPIKRDWGSDSGKHEQTRECRVNTRLMFPRDHKMETIWSNCKLSPRNKKLIHYSSSSSCDSLRLSKEIISHKYGKKWMNFKWMSKQDEKRDPLPDTNKSAIFLNLIFRCAILEKCAGVRRNIVKDFSLKIFIQQSRERTKQRNFEILFEGKPENIVCPDSILTLIIREAVGSAETETHWTFEPLSHDFLPRRFHACCLETKF